MVHWSQFSLSPFLCKTKENHLEKFSLRIQSEQKATIVLLKGRTKRTLMNTMGTFNFLQTQYNSISSLLGPHLLCSRASFHLHFRFVRVYIKIPQLRIRKQSKFLLNPSYVGGDEINWEHRAVPPNRISRKLTQLTERLDFLQKLLVLCRTSTTSQQFIKMPLDRTSSVLKNTLRVAQDLTSLVALIIS